MKSSRDRVMAFVILGLVAVTLLGLLYFMYYDRNMTRLAVEQRRVRAELDQTDESLAEIEKSMPRLKAARRISLPKNPDTAKRLYGNELEKMLRSSEFASNKITVSPRTQPDARGGAAATRKQQPFNRLTFEIQAHGTLRMLTSFLDDFYRTPLLHRIKSLTINRPLTRTQDSIPGELDITMSVEGLIVEGAEDRQTLLSSKVPDSEKPVKLARPSSQYEMIAGNNVFFGPLPSSGPPPEVARGGNAVVDSLLEDKAKRADYDILPETWLEEITIDDKGTRAIIWDSVNEYRYIIKRRYDGTYRVDKYYFIKDAPKPLDIGESTLQFKDANEYLHRSFTVLRIDAADVYLEDKGKIYRLHMGHRMNELITLSREEAAALGLVVKEEKKDKKVEADKDKPLQKDANGAKAAAPAKKDEGR